MKVILSGGGTGGHIYPALSIIKKLKLEEAEIVFVGTKQGLEKDIVPRYGYPLKFIEVAGFKRSLSFDTLRSIYKLFEGLYDAYKVKGHSVEENKYKNITKLKVGESILNFTCGNISCHVYSCTFVVISNMPS